jgi:hypothetical protein
MTAIEIVEAVISAVGVPPGYANTAATLVVEAALEEVKLAERNRCIAEASKLRSNATCKKIRAACGALIDRMRKDNP